MSSRTNPNFLDLSAQCSDSDGSDTELDLSQTSSMADFIDNRSCAEMEFGPPLPPPRLARRPSLGPRTSPVVPRTSLVRTHSVLEEPARSVRPRVSGDSTDSDVSQDSDYESQDEDQVPVDAPCRQPPFETSPQTEDFDGLLSLPTDDFRSVIGAPEVPPPDVGTNPRHRALRFCGTLNNPTEEERKVFESEDGWGSFTKYRMYGKEVGASGTPHLQIYFELKSVHTVAGLQKKIRAAQGAIPSRYALFVCKGTARQNIDYCSKGGDIWSAGVEPKGQGKRSDLDSVASMIMDEGASLQQVARAHPSSFIKYANGFSKLISLVRHVPRSSRTHGLWCFGPTGSGKSRFAHGISPHSSYVKDPSTKWWCGYEQEDTVIVDDYRSNAGLSFSDLLRVADYHPLPIEMKGSHGQFNSKRVVITTPLSIDDTFKHLDWMSEGSLDQLKRRFVELEFGPGKLTHNLKLADVTLPED